MLGFESPCTQPSESPQQPFMQRMSNIPLIHSIGNAYEATKNVSRVVKVSCDTCRSWFSILPNPWNQE